MDNLAQCSNDTPLASDHVAWSAIAGGEIISFHIHRNVVSRAVVFGKR